MKRSELFFSFLLIPMDFAMVVLAGISAYYIRFAELTREIRPVIFNLQFGGYLQIVLMVSLVWIIIFAFAGLYNIKEASRRLSQEVYKVILACSTGFMFIAVYIFFQRELFDSRFIVLVSFALAIIYVSFARIFIRLFQRWLFRYGIGVHKVLLVGNSRTADTLMKDFSSKVGSGFQVVKRVKDFGIERIEELEKFLKTESIDEIIQSDPNLSKAEVLRLYDFADDYHLTFKYAADLLGTKVLNTQVAEIAGIPIVEVKKTPLDGWGRIVKRIFDILISVILIIIFSPIIIITIIVIKIDSRGPIFFSCKDDGSLLCRVGQGGKLFRYFKFRSMMPKTDSMRYNELASKDIRVGSPLVKIKDDPRVTRVGKFIRRWSIDELVELFLVLKGDMSLVGPRPHLPEEVAKYEHHHKKVLTIKPGMTGMAQISGRSDLNFEDEVKLDIYYIENWTLLRDLAILLRTPGAVLRKREAE